MFHVTVCSVSGTQPPGWVGRWVVWGRTAGLMLGCTLAPPSSGSVAP